MKRFLKKLLKYFLINKSKKLDFPIVVFESDDWGSIRNSSKEDIDNIKEKFNLKLDNYQAFDCLENDEDILALAQVLTKHKDGSGNNVKFTLNYVMNNPLLEEFVSSGLKNIPVEKIEDTYSRNKKTRSVLKLVKNNTTVFRPQFHAYEHFNYDKILDAVQSDGVDRYSVTKGCIGMNPCDYSNLDACNTYKNSEEIKNKLVLGLNQFEEVFGNASKTMVFPCYVWDKSLEQICARVGVKALQGKYYQNIPNGESLKKKLNIMGKKSKSGLLYLTRNVDFETSRYYLKNETEEKCVSDTFESVCDVLNKNIPAVICTHRVNYVSGISKENRDYGIGCLDKLISLILQKYPDVRFMFSDELADCYFDKMKK